MFVDPEPKNSLSTLDFIINVLREHERKLSHLGESLESTLKSLTIDDTKQTLTELSESVQALSKTIEILSWKIESQKSSDLGDKQTLFVLQEENQRQKTLVDDIANQLKTFPTKEDIQKLREAIDALNSHTVPELSCNGRA
ncbi:hypothetical protein MUP37_05585 [Candidatus Bathyarchaeota archaeon]|nr:hypothetical protein [Candidatus Bathyarchaeota archaeon]